VARRFSPLGRRPDCLSLSREPVSFTGVHETICSPDEAIFVPGRRGPETRICSAHNQPDQTTECDHVGVHPQLNLPGISQDHPVRNAQARSRLMDLRARDRIRQDIPRPLNGVFGVYHGSQNASQTIKKVESTPREGKTRASGWQRVRLFLELDAARRNEGLHSGVGTHENV